MQLCQEDYINGREYHQEDEDCNNHPPVTRDVFIIFCYLFLSFFDVIISIICILVNS